MSVRHATHFLSRLDRLVGREVDFALELYRDPELLQALLVGLSVPDSAERVALSLADPNQGPFVVVTRDGDFVTCLSRGMTPGQLPVVTRGQLDAGVQKIETLRARLALAMLPGESSERACARLLRRVLDSPDRVSREDFLAVSAWEPLLAPVFMDMYLGMSGELLQQGPILRSTRNTRGKLHGPLRDYWDLCHAAGHLALLSTMSGDPTHFVALTQGQERAGCTLSWALVSTAAIRFIVVGAWAVGRLGKQLLPAYKRALAEDVALFDLFDTVLALVAIGRRTSKLRAEIIKTLRVAHARAKAPEARRLREGAGDVVKVVFATAADVLEQDPGEETDTTLQSMGRHLLDIPETVSLADEIPSDLLCTVPLLSYADGLTDGRKFATSLLMVDAVARGAPEQFYLPKAFVRMWARPWTPALTQQLLEPTRMAEKAQRSPALKTSVPGRNEPSSCGSGRKYKKCCGAAQIELQPKKGRL